MLFASHPRVFLSYSRKDGEPFARQLRIELENAGIAVWQDRTKMEGGVDWWSQITQALQTVQFMVLVATPGALGSEIVRKEWNYARRQGVWVYPVVVPGNPPDFNVLPRWMKTLHFYDYSQAESRESLFKHIQQVEHKRPRVPYVIEKEPDGFVDRPQELDAILNQLLDRERQNPVAITAALKGAGGYGKTTLAHAVCRQPAIQQAFDDGILWVTLGENPGDLIPKLADLIEGLSNERPGFATIEAARNRLKEIVEDQDILLVVDDLWKPEHLLPFTDLGIHCALLVTTRYELTLPVGAHRIHVDAMGAAQAVALLTSGVSVPSNHDRLMHMVKRLGHWPLLLTLANGVLRRRVQNQSTEDALTYVEKALDKLGLDAFDERNSDDRNRAVAKTLQVTFALLKEQEYKRFRELAIFPEDADIPLSVVGQLWRATGGLDDVETEMLCELLHNLSLLLKFDPGKQVIRLHDVIRTYLVTLEPALTSSEQDQLVQWHVLFLDAYGVTDWVRLPIEDEYAWHYLSYHLFQAKRHAELRSLLTNLHWLQRKLEQSTPNTLIMDFGHLTKDPELALIRSAIRMSAHILAEFPEMLYAQLYARLVSYHGENDLLTSLLEQIQSEFKRPTLLPLLPSMDQAGDALVRVIGGHNGFVASVAVVPGSPWILSTVGYDVRSTQRRIQPEKMHGMLMDAVLDEMALDSQRAELGVVHIWNMETGLQVKKHEIHQQAIHAMAVMQDGRRVVSASAEAIKIWDLDSGDVFHTFIAHKHEVNALAVSADGSRVASGDASGRICLWDSTSAQLIMNLDGHDDEITCLSFIPGDRFLVSASRDRTLRIWDTENGNCIHALNGHAKFVAAVAVTPDGKHILSASWDRTIKIWDAASGKCLRTLEGHTSEVTTLTVTPDGKRIVSGSRDNTVRVWQLEDGRQLSVFPEHNYVTTVAVSRDGQYAISGSYANTVRVWDLSRTAEVRTRHAHDNRLSSIAVSRDGSLVASASWDRTIKLWDGNDFSEIRTLMGHTNWVLSVAFSPDGRHVVSGSSDETIRVWDVEQGTIVHSIGGHNDYVNSVLVSPDGQEIVSGSRYALLRVWSFENGQLLRTIGEHHRGIRAVRLTGQGRLIALVSGMEFPGVNRLGSIGRSALRQEMLRSVATETKLELYEYESGKKLGTLASDDVVFCFAITPDESRFVTASWYEKISVGDFQGAYPIRVLTGHRWIIEDIDITTDGKYVVSVSQDHTVRIWDADNGICISMFDLDEKLTSCAWMHNGRTVVVGGESGRLHVLRLMLP